MEETSQGPEDPSVVDDDVLREQSFKRAKGLNLDSFMVAPASDSEPESPQQEVAVVEDAAVGELAEVFTNEPVSVAPVQTPPLNSPFTESKPSGKVWPWRWWLFGQR